LARLEPLRGHAIFLEDGRPISDPEITRWRWSESLKTLVEVMLRMYAAWLDGATDSDKMASAASH
jgi:hypothetical protein